MKALAEKIQSVEKQLKDKKESDDKSEYERAKKDVKEEATKREVNVDLIHENKKENPQKLTQLSSRSHPRHLVGKRTAQKRHHHRHHKRQPGEQQFPIQVVTG